MNPAIVYCNVCFKTALAQAPDSHFYFTSCGKVLCQKCLSQMHTCQKCTAAGQNCSKQPISNQMDPQVGIFFKDNFSTLKRILKAEEFQTDRYKKLAKYQNQKVLHLENSLREKSNLVKILKDKLNSKESIVNNLTMKLKETEQYLQKIVKQTSHNSFNSPSFQGKKNSPFANNFSLNSYGEDMNVSRGNSAINISQNSFHNVHHVPTNVHHIPTNVHTAAKVATPHKPVSFERNVNANRGVFHSTPIGGQTQRQHFDYRKIPSSIVSGGYSSRKTARSRVGYY